MDAGRKPWILKTVKGHFFIQRNNSGQNIIIFAEFSKALFLIGWQKEGQGIPDMQSIATGAEPQVLGNHIPYNGLYAHLHISLGGKHYIY